MAPPLSRDAVSVPHVCLTDQERDAIRESLRPLTLTSEQEGWLFAEVGWIRTRLRASRKLGASDKLQSPQKTRRELEQVLEGGEEILRVAEGLRGTERGGELSEEVRVRLVREGWDEKQREQLLSLVHALRTSAREALGKVGPLPKGPTYLGAERLAVSELRDVWEQLTGRRATHYVDASPERKRPPFSEFVEAALKPECPDLNSFDHVIREALRPISSELERVMCEALRETPERPIPEE